nr:SDR family oxidoreductase [Halalkalibacterium ligniniphilum]
MRQGFITGASGGIGAATARELATPGRTLYVHYNRDKEAIDALVKELEEKGADAVPVQGDLSTIEGTKSLLSLIPKTIDVFVHSGGVSHEGLFTDLAYDELFRLMNVHLLSMMHITQAFLPHMIRQRSGKVIAVSSIWGETGGAYEVAYSAAKGGMNSFVKALAKEVALNNIQVNGVAPGAILTPMLDVYTEQEKNDLQAEIPAGRLGTPDDVAHAIAFLCSDKANYINGQILSINGGWYC